MASRRRRGIANAAALYGPVVNLGGCIIVGGGCGFGERGIVERVLFKLVGLNGSQLGAAAVVVAVGVSRMGMDGINAQAAMAGCCSFSIAVLGSR